MNQSRCGLEARFGQIVTKTPARNTHEHPPGPHCRCASHWHLRAEKCLPPLPSLPLNHYRQGPAINGHLERAEAAPVQLQPGEWIRIEGAALGASGVKVTLRICWLPAEHCRPGFTPASPDGASGCGGRADSGTSLEKQAVMVAAWGEDGSEWCPDGAYVPCSTEKMFSLEDMEDEFKVWQEHYAMDPIFSKLGTAAPPLRTVLPIYGVNKPTMAGVIYRRRVARWRQGERTCYLEPDKDATVTHTG